MLTWISRFGFFHPSIFSFSRSNVRAANAACEREGGGGRDEAKKCERDGGEGEEK